MFSFFYETKKEDMNDKNKKERVLKEEDYSDLINEFKEVRIEINSMYASLKDREVAGLDLEKVIKFFNSFGRKFLKEEDIDYDKSVKGIITINLSSNKEEKDNNERQTLNLVLNNGKKIILTENSNLNIFNYDELVEILRLLDTLIVDKSKDSLRSNIVNQINIISMISFIKNT